MNLYLNYFFELAKHNLFAHELLHGIIAFPFAFLYWKKTKDHKGAFVIMFIAYFIDLDHFIDYFSYYGFNFNLFKFLGGEHFEVTQRAIVPLHAWEWVIVLSLISLKRGWKSLSTILLMGIIPHLILDSINQNHFLFYSIIYRASVSDFGFLW